MLVFTAMCRCILDGARMSTAVLLAVLLGMVNFISYFTKEVAAAFIISEAAALIAAPLIAGGKRKEFFQALAVFLLMFFLLCLYLKFGSIIFSVWPGTQTSAFSDLKIA